MKYEAIYFEKEKKKEPFVNSKDEKEYSCWSPQIFSDVICLHITLKNLEPLRENKTLLEMSNWDGVDRENLHRYLWFFMTCVLFYRCKKKEHRRMKICL